MLTITNLDTTSSKHQTSNLYEDVFPGSNATSAGGFRGLCRSVRGAKHSCAMFCDKPDRTQNLPTGNSG